VRSTLDDVAVGENDPADIDNHTGAQRTRLARARLEIALTKEAGEEWIVGKGGNNCLLDACRIDVDHRRSDGLNDGRKTEPDLCIVLRHYALHLRRYGLDLRLGGRTTIPGGDDHAAGKSE